MWPGPYGEWGSRKYLLASLDQSLARMGLDYVDIFYSHRVRPGHPARGDDGRAGHRGAAGQGALRRHLVLLAGTHPGGGRDPARAGHAAADPPAVVLDAQPLDRGRRCCSTRSASEGIGCIAFSPLAQGMLTDRYLDGIPEDSRAAQGKSARPGAAHRRGARARPRASTRSRTARGQSLAQLALAWVLRDERVTSALIGASQRRAARGQPRRGRQPGALRRRARRHRPGRRGQRDQPLGVPSEDTERRLLDRDRPPPGSGQPATQTSLICQLIRLPTDRRPAATTRQRS